MCVWAGISAARTVVGRELQMVEGNSTVHFLPSVLVAENLSVELDATGKADEASAEETSGFEISSADLAFRLVDGRLTRLEEGTVKHRGGFKLVCGDRVIDATGFRIRAVPQKEGFQLSVLLANEDFVAFDLLNPRAIYDSEKKELALAAMDLHISVGGALRLGKPELAQKQIGSMSVYAKAEPIDGGGEVYFAEELAADGGGDMDVAISDLSSLSILGRSGTYPNGRNGLSMLTESCNVGDLEIPWNAPMQTTHPVIAMNLYRLKDGKFEQVGWSWLKHGFLATNSNGCVGGCQPAGTGSRLGVNCSDTYGTGNNGDRQYLGGRDEVNPFTGVWTCTNSYFSNFQNDCIRRRPSSGEFNGDSVTHRLEVPDADMANAGARYFYEAFYIHQNDVNTYNQIAWREASFSGTAPNWSISSVGGFQLGPAINNFGDMRSTAQPTTQGDAIVAVDVTDLGNGMWHYEYAVYNHNLDRQIRTFTIPIEAGANVQNVGFRDIDQNSANDWSSAYSNGAIVWSTGTFGSANPNPLKYASIFNFRFDANVPPASSTAMLGLFKPGSGTELAAVTRGPLVLDPVDAFQIVNGSITSGNEQSLEESDDDRLVLGPTPTGSRFGSGITADFTAPAGTISQIVFGVESRNSLLPSQANQTLELWNWNTGAWELLDTRSTSSSDARTLITVSTNAGRFVNSSTRQVRGRVVHTSLLGITGMRWTMSLDEVGIHFN